MTDGHGENVSGSPGRGPSLIGLNALSDAPMCAFGATNT